MAKTLDKSIGNLRLFDFEGFSQSANSMELAFALSNANGELVYLAEPEQFNSDRQSLTEVCQSLLEGYKQHGVTDIMLRTSLAIALKQNQRGTNPEDCEGVAVIDFGAVELNDFEVAAAKQMLAQLAKSYTAQAKSRQQIEMVMTLLDSFSLLISVMEKLNG